ncbi:MAG: prepilin-type N-terminal cleavage/methylation domain-containing protein [Candidatus Methylacidiphilales bacterium]|nr:prepilin-type N-terminal cleavage/methylation domain-containing protein [Candidatus Methylacidiphilales bacterium]
MRRGFTLVELLAVVVVVAVLASFAIPAVSKVLTRGRQAASLSNIRQLGMSLLSYAADNQYKLPPRTNGTDPVTGAAVDKWPKALYTYMPDVRAFIDPSDPLPANRDPAVFFTNRRNNSSYVYNGFNDLGAYTDPSYQVHTVNLTSPSTLILLGKKRHIRGDFYMDVDEGAQGNQIEVLDWDTYGKTLHYFFADGSARWLTQAEYDATLWLVDKTYTLKK